MEKLFAKLVYASFVFVSLWFRRMRAIQIALDQPRIQKSAEGVLKPNFAAKRLGGSLFTCIFCLFWGFHNGTLDTKGMLKPLKHPLDPRLL